MRNFIAHFSEAVGALSSQMQEMARTNKSQGSISSQQIVKLKRASMKLKDFGDQSKNDAFYGLKPEVVTLDKVASEEEDESSDEDSDGGQKKASFGQVQSRIRHASRYAPLGSKLRSELTGMALDIERIAGMVDRKAASNLLAKVASKLDHTIRMGGINLKMAQDESEEDVAEDGSHSQASKKKASDAAIEAAIARELDRLCLWDEEEIGHDASVSYYDRRMIDGMDYVELSDAVGASVHFRSPQEALKIIKNIPTPRTIDDAMENFWQDPQIRRRFSHR